MKNDQLKKILRPMIRECIYDILSDPQVTEKIIKEGLQTLVVPSQQPIKEAKTNTKENMYKEFVQRSVNNQVSATAKKDFISEAAPKTKKSMLEEMLEGVEDIDSKDRSASRGLRQEELEELPGASHWGEVLKRL